MEYRNYVAIRETIYNLEYPMNDNTIFKIKRMEHGKPNIELYHPTSLFSQDTSCIYFKYNDFKKKDFKNNDLKNKDLKNKDLKDSNQYPMAIPKGDYKLLSINNINVEKRELVKVNQLIMSLDCPIIFTILNIKNYNKFLKYIKKNPLNIQSVNNKQILNIEFLSKISAINKISRFYHNILYKRKILRAVKIIQRFLFGFQYFDSSDSFNPIIDPINGNLMDIVLEGDTLPASRIVDYDDTLSLEYVEEINSTPMNSTIMDSTPMNSTTNDFVINYMKRGIVCMLYYEPLNTMEEESVITNFLNLELFDYRKLLNFFLQKAHPHKLQYVYKQKPDNSVSYIDMNKLCSNDKPLMLFFNYIVNVYYSSETQKENRVIIDTDRNRLYFNFDEKRERDIFLNVINRFAENINIQRFVSHDS